MNRKMKFNLGVGFLLLAFILQGFTNGINSSEKAEWQLSKKSKDISLFYRWIELGNNSKTREMKVEFTINAEISEILSYFRNAKSYESWAAGIKKCNIERTSDSIWYTHTVMNYPFPFKQKDLVTRHLVVCNGVSATIEVEAAPDYFSEIEGIERMKDYQGIWYFSTAKNGSTAVEYRVISFTNPIFPRFVQDPIVQKICVDSFIELKQLAEK